MLRPSEAFCSSGVSCWIGAASAAGIYKRVARSAILGVIHSALIGFQLQWQFLSYFYWFLFPCDTNCVRRADCFGLLPLGRGRSVLTLLAPGTTSSLNPYSVTARDSILPSDGSVADTGLSLGNRGLHPGSCTGRCPRTEPGPNMLISIPAMRRSSPAALERTP